MLNRLRVITLSAVVACSALVALPAMAFQCQCACRYPTDYSVLDAKGISHACAGETTWQLPNMDYDGLGCVSTNVTDTCKTTCTDLGYTPFHAFAEGNNGQKYFCDFEASNNCNLPQNPNDPACKSSLTSCFCKYPATFATADCRGKTFSVGTTSAPDQCPTACTTIYHGDSDGPAVSSYQDKCDFIVSGDTCLQNSKQTKNDTCTSAAQASQNAKASALAQASEGSVIGLPLPIGQRSIPTVIGLIVNRVMGVVGAIAFLMFVYGGFSWMMAAGNEERIKHARQIIVWAALGMVVIFAAYGITKAIIQITTPIGS